jgi:hypothetical protein
MHGLIFPSPLALQSGRRTLLALILGTVFDFEDQMFPDRQFVWNYARGSQNSDV